jgi:uncharacterized protein (DUF427 family)
MSTGTSFAGAITTPTAPTKARRRTYYDITDGDGTDLTAAVWYYDEPFPPVAEIKGHVAFYTERVTIGTTLSAAL